MLFLKLAIVLAFTTVFIDSQDIDDPVIGLNEDANGGVQVDVHVAVSGGGDGSQGSGGNAEANPPPAPLLRPPHEVTVFDRQHFEGPSTTIAIQGCTNLPSSWNNRISSLRLNGKCIVIWESENCTGSFARLRTTTTQGRLTDYDLDNQVSSMSLCENQ